ncbi:hypothetical protein [Porphyromonas sp.]|uniref:hypothetical protein n=1 Tax=Porphyromonas sp. TaxID=1924944 RepID=UPI0026DAF645|nr:hypothetical protein [Porphyromonas sp.]MDO4771588.1 hypothetical protein [Porphyromonas sp.]
MQSATLQQTPRPLRFVRWSRRSSATFHSIGREVTIGHLASNVVERLSLKSVKGKAYRCGTHPRHGGRQGDKDAHDEWASPLDQQEALASALLLPARSTSESAEIGSVR